MTRASTAALCLVIASMAVGAVAAAPTSSPPTWTHRKPILVAAGTGEDFVEVALDAEVYREAAPGLGDLRIRDGDGRDVAYVLRKHESDRTRSSRGVPLLDLVKTRRGERQFVLDLGPGAGLHNGVRIHVADAARNFRVPVRIEASADRQQWSLVRAGGFVYDVEGETRAADTSVSYPVSSARYVRVTVAAAAGQALAVTAAEIFVDTPGLRRDEAVAASLVERSEDSRTRTTRLVLDLGGRHPVDRAELDIADRLFSRVAFVEASEDRQAWRWLGSGSVSAIVARGLDERQTTLKFPEHFTRYVRITLQNLDDRPLDVKAVRFASARRGLVFRPKPGQQYVLEYGHPGAPRPSYDLAQVVRHLDEASIAIATLGPASPLPPPAPPSWTAQYPIVVWTVMAAAMLTLAGLLLRLARQIRLPPSSG